jgi:hypothetical protein
MNKISPTCTNSDHNLDEISPFHRTADNDSEDTERSLRPPQLHMIPSLGSDMYQPLRKALHSKTTYLVLIRGLLRCHHDDGQRSSFCRRRWTVIIIGSRVCPQSSNPCREMCDAPRTSRADTIVASVFQCSESASYLVG